MFQLDLFQTFQHVPVNILIAALLSALNRLGGNNISDGSQNLLFFSCGLSKSLVKLSISEPKLNYLCLLIGFDLFLGHFQFL